MSTDTAHDAEEERITNTDTVTVDHGATRTSTIVAIGAAVVAAITSVPFAFLAVPLGLGGVAIVAAGLLGEPDRSWVTIGTVGLFLSVLVAGGFGAPVEFLLISTLATIVAWDSGQHAIGLGAQIGSHSRTQRNELVHAGLSIIVGAIAAALGYAVYGTAGGGRPAAALVMLLFAILFLTWAIRS